MWQEKYSPTWPILDQALGEGRKKKEGKKRKEKREFRERDTTFSLNFPAIRPAVPDGARGNVLLGDKSYKWKLESRVLTNSKR